MIKAPQHDPQYRAPTVAVTTMHTRNRQASAAIKGRWWLPKIN
jgi:hypothetical protein